MTTTRTAPPTASNGGEAVSDRRPLAAPTAIETDDTDDVVLLGLHIAMPTGSSLRLDQPCAFEHGSIGGWRQDADGEVSYTLLWRPLGYWTKTAIDDMTEPGSLQPAFVEQALASTRKDSRAVDVDERRPMTVAGHTGELLDTAIQVRRKVGRVALRRRQVLWTCAATRRHLAFEVSTLAGDAERVPPLFAQIASTVSCCPDAAAS